MNHQLCDAVATAHLERFVRVGVEHDHLQLTPVCRVDEAGCIGQRNAVGERQPTAWQHPAGMALGNGDGHTRGHQHPPARRGDDYIDARPQVEAGVARVGVGRQR